MNISPISEFAVIVSEAERSILDIWCIEQEMIISIHIIDTRDDTTRPARSGPTQTLFQRLYFRNY